ncbi:MAG: asparagine synthase (glutamine-hydrolyzing) [Acidobacteriaceae bacterium]
MCGIAGFISTDEAVASSSVDAVRRMTDRMRLRGPDAAGVWTGNGVALGHRRLAIQDLDARSNQPMVSTDGKYCITFNGEIYNFHELRRELEAEGAAFRTTSDTEVLLALYARDGERMLPRLRGMFAFAIWDAATREVFLARDPYGIKPLYYAQTERGVVFASQVKAVLASGLVSPESEPAGVAGFYLWGSVQAPWTLYRGVFALTAGHWMRVRAGRAETPVRWNDIRCNWRQQDVRLSGQELQEVVRKAVTDSVRAHLVSDVPVSVFLSGGIDSGTMASLIAELGGKVEGITVGFDEFTSHHEDEVPSAAVIAKHYGLPHHVRRISREEFEQDIPQILDAMDQPSVDGVNTWFAAKAAAERGYKVVLSGVGGDELFYGYKLMKQLPRDATLGRAAAAIPGGRWLVGAACSILANGHRHPKLKGIAEFMGSLEGVYYLKRCVFLPEELPLLMGEERAREGLERLGGWPPGMSKANAVNDAAGVCLLDSTLYLRNQLLRDSDWASMAHSLELRTPLVDAALLDALKLCHTSFAGGAGKRLLAQSPARPLPEKVITRPKSGFGVPMTQWLAAATERREWSSMALLADRGTPWTRRWAKVVMDEGFKDGQ